MLKDNLQKYLLILLIIILNFSTSLKLYAEADVQMFDETVRAINKIISKVDDSTNRIKTKKTVQEHNKNYPDELPWIFIPTGLKFKKQSFPEIDSLFNNNNAGKTIKVRLFFSNSTSSTKLSPQYLDVNKGSVVFYTSVGSFTILPNGITVSHKNKKSMAQVAEFESNTNHTGYGSTFQNIRVIFGIDQKSKKHVSLSMNMVGLKNRDDLSYDSFCQDLLVSEEGPASFIVLTFKFSADYNGNINKWTIQPNWK